MINEGRSNGKVFLHVSVQYTHTFLMIGFLIADLLLYLSGVLVLMSMEINGIHKCIYRNRFLYKRTSRSLSLVYIVYQAYINSNNFILLMINGSFSFFENDRDYCQAVRFRANQDDGWIDGNHSKQVICCCLLLDRSIV